MEPGRAEAVLGHQPARRKDGEVTVGGAGNGGGRGEHGVDGGVGMVKGDGVDAVEEREVVFVGHVVAVPGDDVEGRVIDGRAPEPAEEFVHDAEVAVAVFKGGDGSFEVARIGEAVGTDGISYAETEEKIGVENAAELRRLTLALYERAQTHAEARGLILADTKFEFGKTAEGIILADEVLTPDSSRFWEAGGWAPGGAQPSFDKQYVRDYLESIHWNKQAPAPGLPDEVVERTKAKYLEAFRRLTGRGIQV
jgi:SAICAR synthetase